MLDDDWSPRMADLQGVPRDVIKAISCEREFWQARVDEAWQRAHRIGYQAGHETGYALGYDDCDAQWLDGFNPAREYAAQQARRPYIDFASLDRRRYPPGGRASWRKRRPRRGDYQPPTSTREAATRDDRAKARTGA